MIQVFPYRPAAVGRIFFALALLHGVAAGQTADIGVRPAVPRIEVSKGTVVSTGFVVTNTSARELGLSASLILPAGWRTVFRESSFRIRAGAEELRLVSISFPPETETGSYEVRYRLSDPGNPSRAVEARLTVVVTPIRQVEVRMLEAPRYIAAGEAFTALFEVRNTGNAAGSFLLKTDNTHGFPVLADSLAVILGPRASREVRVRVRTAPSIRTKTPTTVALTAILQADSAVLSRASAVVDVIPRAISTGDQTFDYPVRVTARAAGEDERLGGQIEVSGQGPLTAAGNDRLEVLLRTTDIQSQSSLGLRDEYRVQYASPAGEIRFGDWTYTLSPLTEFSRFAFGGGGKVVMGNATAGGFYNESRFYRPGQRQAGGFVRYEPLEGYSLGLQHLDKRDHIRAGVSSARVLMAPAPGAMVDLEYGVSNAAGVRDDALAAQFRTRFSWGSFDARVIDAGGKYQGYYRDLSFGSMNLNLEPIRNVQTEAYFRSERRNRDNDTLVSFVPSEQVIQVGVGYSNRVSVSYRRTVQEDLRPAPLYGRSEEIARLRVGYPLAGVDLFSDIEAGVSRNTVIGGTYPFRRYALFAALSTAGVSSTLSLEYSDENSLYTAEKLERLSVGLGGSVLLTRSTFLQGNLYWTRLSSATRQEFAMVDLLLQHEFSNRHQIQLRVRRNSFVPSIRTSELAYVIQYKVPLAIPLQRTGSGERLSGMILDEGGKPVRNVLVNVGSTAAISNARGEFSVLLPPGRHYLVLDRASIGLDRVTRQPMPLEVEVKEGREERVILNVVRGSVISADVRLAAFSEGTDSLVDAGPGSGILVEAVKGPELRRRVSDSRGHVEFGELTPGTWRLRLVGGDIPALHQTEPAEITLSLEPGDRKTGEFRIAPRKRTIRIIQTGEVPVLKAEPAPQRHTPLESCLITYHPELRGYVLQVSSWLTRSKAVERMRVTSRVTGKKATVERASVPGLGIRYRVKVGVFSSVAEAEIQCRILQRIENEPAHD